MNVWFLFLLCALTVARIARFIHLDSLIDGPRNYVLTWLMEPRDGWKGGVATKLAELLDCPWCISIWVALGLVLVLDWGTGYSLPAVVLWVPALSMIAVMFVEYGDGVKQIAIKRDG